MYKIVTSLVLAVCCLLGFSGCNSNEEVVYTMSSGTTIRSFSLQNNDDVLPNLDSVFFSIDLYSREIFNADSLPYGTSVKKLTPVILTEGVSAIELTVTYDDGVDSVYNYYANSTDSLDFTNPVKMRVISANEEEETFYTIKVNVHKVKADSLVWSRVQSSNLPSALGSINEQHTTMSPDHKFYCITRYQSSYSIAYSTDLTEAWQVAEIFPGFVPEVNSLRATTNSLYILDKDGNLFKSEDNGLTWSGTGNSARNLIGAYGDDLIMTSQTADAWNIMSYPSGKSIVASGNFPVLNTSNAVAVTFEMSSSPQLFIVGGRKADDSLTNDSWAYDGQNWVNITRTSLPKKLENLALVPYFQLEPDTISWKVSQPGTVLLAMCGNDGAGIPNETIYMSSDYGMIWKKAPDSMQLPLNIIPVRTLAQAYPFTARKSTNEKKNEINLPTTLKPIRLEWSGAGFEMIENASRATSPVTEWDVPYIYLFGGVGTNGNLYNTIYRGVIEQFTFKPLQ